ncbi:Ankyrin repeat-containing protein BDA1 [Camellia lanceoleosa]|nr:Ankyrin repeat-containing protein BDA1 [Camellia lanceoleosa]
MDPDLMEPAAVENINDLYARIQSKPDILGKELFVETPLHLAASAGQTHLALEILRLQPSFGKKLNPEGLSPLHLALQNRNSETVRRLVKLTIELIRVKGRRVSLLALCSQKQTIKSIFYANFSCLPIVYK